MVNDHCGLIVHSIIPPFSSSRIIIFVDHYVFSNTTQLINDIAGTHKSRS